MKKVCDKCGHYENKKDCDCECHGNLPLRSNVK